MLIDSKGRFFGKISIIDFLVVLLVIFMILGVAYKFTKSSTPGVFVKTKDLNFTFINQEIPDYIAKHIKKGDEVKDFDKGTLFGTVSSFQINNSISIAQTAYGEFMQTSKPGYSSVVIQIKGKGVYDGNGVTISNTDYFIGKVVNARIGNCLLTTLIESINEKE